MVQLFPTIITLYILPAADTAVFKFVCSRRYTEVDSTVSRVRFSTFYPRSIAQVELFHRIPTSFDSGFIIRVYPLNKLTTGTTFHDDANIENMHVR